MNEENEILLEELEKVRVFFENENKGEKGYYRLYTIKHVNSNYNNRDARASNFETETIEDSLVRLKNEIISKGEYSLRFFLLKAYTSRTDSKPIEIIFKNPFFDETVQQGSSINGLRQGNTNNAMVFELMKQNYEQTAALREEIKDLKHSHQLERLEERIAGIEEEKKTKIDRITGFFETEVGQQVAAGIMGLVQAKVLQAPAPVPVPEKKEYQEPTPKYNQQTDDTPSYSEEQSKQINKLNAALSRLDDVFNGEGIKALEELSIYCKNNPGLAQNLRTKKSTTND